MSSKCVVTKCDFLGMTLKFKEKKVSVDMREFLMKAVTGFGEKVLTSAVTPEKGDLKGTYANSPIADE